MSSPLILALLMLLGTFCISILMLVFFVGREHFVTSVMTHEAALNKITEEV